MLGGLPGSGEQRWYFPGVRNYPDCLPSSCGRWAFYFFKDSLRLNCPFGKIPTAGGVNQTGGCSAQSKAWKRNRVRYQWVWCVSSAKCFTNHAVLITALCWSVWQERGSDEAAPSGREQWLWAPAPCPRAEQANGRFAHGRLCCPGEPTLFSSGDSPLHYTRGLVPRALTALWQAGSLLAGPAGVTHCRQGHTTER